MNDAPVAGFADPVVEFGTGPDEDNDADITGDLNGPESAVEFFPNPEDDGDINKSSDSGLMDLNAVFANGIVGDGPFGFNNSIFLGPGRYS